MSFDVPAVFIVMDTLWGARTRVGGTSWGTNGWPTDGTDALPPGRPGEGGSGGHFTSNLDLARLVDNTGGAAGRRAADVHGGLAGQPQNSAHWKATAWDNLFHYPRNLDYAKTEVRTTTAGNPAQAPAAARPAGAAPAPTVGHRADTWVHPFQVRVVLGYLRSAFLGGNLGEVHARLADYDTALSTLAARGDTVEDLFDPLQLHADQAEVATLRRRLDAGLDYHGHPAGWTPMLSLPASLRLYERETGWALRTLMLARWIEDASREREDAAAVLTHAVKQLDEDTRNAAESIGEGERLLKTLAAKSESLDKEMFELRAEQSALEEQLLADAKTHETEKAMIGLATKSFAAVTSVIPYGQPALSSLGSLAPMIAQWDEGSAADHASKLSAVFATVAKGGLDDAASRLLKEAAEKKAVVPKDADAAQKKKLEDAEQEALKDQASRLSALGKSLGPALTQINDAVRGLSVPQSEVDAELARLEAQRPEYAELTKKIKLLNARKATFAGQLDRASAMVGGAYGRIASNFASARVLGAQRGTALAGLNHAARLYVSDLGQRAKERLCQYLYYLAKSYESTMLASCPGVDFEMVDVFDRITDRVGRHGADATLSAENLEQFAQALRPLFDDNRKRMEDALLQDFPAEFTKTVTLRLSQAEAPELLQALNERGETALDLKTLGLITADMERARIKKITVTGVALDSPPERAAGDSVQISLEPLGDGTLRYAGKLYAVRSRARDGTSSARSPALWGATFPIDNPKHLHAIVPSDESAELLKMLLGETSDEIKEKLIMPPAWTTLKLSLTPNTKCEVPQVQRIALDLQLNYTQPGDDAIVVLDVCATADGDGAHARVLTPRIGCSPADGNGHRGGLGEIYRFYPRGERVTLEAEPSVGRWQFDHWDVGRATAHRPLAGEHRENRLTLSLDADLEVTARYVCH
jgi:hypothetical protein